MDIDIADFADALDEELGQQDTLARTGRVQEVVGTVIRASGLDVQMGELCELRDGRGDLKQRAEVVGLTRGGALLSPFGGMTGLSSATRIVGTGKTLSVAVGDGLRGRILDGLGEPIDGKGPLQAAEWRPVMAACPDPLTRRMIEQPFVTGLRVIDGMTTLGEGQRMGIFAPAGVGKSTLMGMLARNAECDINVIALIGERGREVREFMEQVLGKEGMARSVVVCATSDRSSIERAKAAHVATAVAEYFRDKGLRVLLMMDSLTRFARALREIGLASGELPARRGFPPSVFAELPRLLERSGMGEKGSITALYTVLAEDESGGDPVAEEVRGILDGHLLLSRKLAAANHYPAIDVLRSLSRVMPQVVAAEQVKHAAAVRKLMARYDELETLIQLGEYKQGSDPAADLAIARTKPIEAFLQQGDEQAAPFADTAAALKALAAQ
jgi:ATP synthase in type III secretion protein N